MKKYVKILLKTYIDLQRADLELQYLKNCGVDNWDTGISIEEWAEKCGETLDTMIYTEKDCKIIEE